MVGRIVAGAAVVIALAAVAVVLFGSGGEDYIVKARFVNASQLVKGNLVQVAGAPVGTVKSIDLTDDGQAEVTMKITDGDYAPLLRGTHATVRQASLSGVANRYVDLHLPAGGGHSKIDDGGTLPTSETTTAVDLDELFNTFDPKTRKALSGVIRGFGTQYAGKGAEANRGWMYLNPSLAASSRLFQELNYDTPMLKRFIVSSSKFVTDVAERHDDLAGLVDNLATTTGAIGRQKNALSTAIAELPPFMRRANTTFVNLRATLDDLAPLVEESKPVAKKLRPFMAELRPLARDARPTLRDLSRLIRTAGPDNDLIDATKSIVPVRDIAVRDVEANGKKREGAFPASIRALHEGTPELGFARPYAVDLTGWFDDFSHSVVYDALGGASRAAPHVNGFAEVNSVLAPIPPDLRQQVFQSVASLNQRNRCPGAAEHPAPDKSNPWKPTEDYNCDPSQVLPGR